MRFMINQSLNGTEIAFNVDAVSSPIEIGTVDLEHSGAPESHELSSFELNKVRLLRSCFSIAAESAD